MHFGGDDMAAEIEFDFMAQLAQVSTRKVQGGGLQITLTVSSRDMDNLDGLLHCGMRICETKLKFLATYDEPEGEETPLFDDE